MPAGTPVMFSACSFFILPLDIVWEHSQTDYAQIWSYAGWINDPGVCICLKFCYFIGQMLMLKGSQGGRDKGCTPARGRKTEGQTSNSEKAQADPNMGRPHKPRTQKTRDPS